MESKPRRITLRWGGYYRLDEKNQQKIEDPYHSYLTVNAIDGTIIDRAAGY